MLRLALLLAAAVLAAPGCLVLGLHPAYDDEAIGWDPLLLGTWHDADDNVTVRIERGEWRSYRIHYTHPIESGEVTGHLTAIDDVRYLDVMPATGEDRGAFVVPVHAVVRMELDGDRLELTALSYDWFFDRLKGRRPVPGLEVALDQKENALISAPTARLREWLRRQPAGGAMFGASAVFTRKP